MSTTVEITLADDGSISVGLADGPSSDPDDMQPAKSIGDALAMARHILSNPQQAQAADDQEDAAEGDGDVDTSGADGTGGGTGPDASGSVVQDDTQDTGASQAGSKQGDQSAQEIWNALIDMNKPMD